jgi:streptomycin 6-kinase
MLVDRVDRLAQRWHLELIDPLPSHVSFLAPARRDGEAVVLKIPMQGVEFPYAQANNRPFEADALREWDGDGSIRLLAFDDESGAMLLEACEPGGRLADERSVEEADDVACELLERLWRHAPKAAFSTTADLAADWGRRAVAYYEQAGAPFERELFDEVLALLDGFTTMPPNSTVLHGDFHHNNVLAAQREPWLAIDPLPLVGEREYDLVMFQLFRMGSMTDPVHDWDNTITSMSERLHLRSHRVKEWIYVRLVCDALAFLSHGGAPDIIEQRQEDVWSARVVRSLL